MTAAGKARAGNRDRGTFGPGPVQRVRGLHALRPLHHARRDRLDAARDLRQRPAHHPEPELRRDQLRDDPRHSRDLSRQPRGRQRRRPPVHGQLARPLGRRHARRGDQELHGQDEHRRQRQRHAPQRSADAHRAVHARRPGDDPVHRDGQRPGDVHGAFHLPAHDHEAAELRGVRVLVPRGQRRRRPLAERRARVREAGRGSRSRPARSRRRATGTSTARRARAPRSSTSTRASDRRTASWQRRE